MQTFAWKRVFLAAAVWAVVAAVPARAAEAPAAPQEAAAVKVDCLAPFAGAISPLAQPDILAENKPQPQSTESCRLYGSGALSYCDGSCPYTHQVCTPQVVGKAHSCVCK